MSEWKNGKAVVYEDRHGNTRCSACSAPLWRNDGGNMPESCPQCGAPLDYDARPHDHKQMSLFDVAAEPMGTGTEPPTQPTAEPHVQTVTEPPAEDVPPKTAGVIYYPIDESMARRAHDMISMTNYREGSATAEYRAAVDNAAALVERCKAATSPFYHDKLDALLDRYARRLAKWKNDYNRNGASCPSVLVCGPANFPTRKKARQNSREDSLWAEYKEIQAILDKIKSVGTGPVDLADPHAREILNEQIQRLQSRLEEGKALNAWYRKHKTFEGFPGLSAEAAAKLSAEWEDTRKRCPWVDKPFPDYHLASLRGKIKRVQDRLDELDKLQSQQTAPEEHEGFQIVRNTVQNRLQIIFDRKPDESTRQALKDNGFLWSPRNSAWQRQ